MYGHEHGNAVSTCPSILFGFRQIFYVSLCGTMDYFVAISCCLMRPTIRGRFSFSLFEPCLFLNLVVSISCHRSNIMLKAYLGTLCFLTYFRIAYYSQKYIVRMAYKLFGLISCSFEVLQNQNLLVNYFGINAWAPYTTIPHKHASLQSWAFASRFQRWIL